MPASAERRLRQENGGGQRSSVLHGSGEILVAVLWLAFATGPLGLPELAALIGDVTR
jgi:hypothetical protein